MITGNAVTTMNCVMKLIHVKTGIRMSFMPGARMLMMVAMKLKPAASDAIPRIWRPMAQKSMLIPGEYCLAVRFAYPNHPPSGAAPTRKLALRNRPPNKNAQ